MKQLTDAAKLIITGVIAVMLISAVALIVLAYNKIPVPESLSTIPITCVGALIGLLAKVHPDSTDVVPDPKAGIPYKPLS